MLFRRILPRVAVNYGATAIHAASIAIDDRCLLMLGHSGAGKSTLTAFCASSGWRVLSDDTSLLWTDGRIEAEPVQRGIGVWDETRDALALAMADCVPMPGYDGRKWCFSPPEPPSSSPHSLSAILLLDRSPHVDMPQLVALTRRNALSALMAQNIPFLSVSCANTDMAASLGRIVELSRLPAYRLTYPDGYTTLPQVEEMLRHMPIARTDA